MSTDCTFSHQVPSYVGIVPTDDKMQATEESLFSYLHEYALSNSDSLSRIADPDQERDLSDIDRMREEMEMFAKGPIAVSEVYECPYLAETGNCLYGVDCIHLHDKDKRGVIERSEEWYPESRDCETCKGYKFSIQPTGCERCVGS